MGAFFFSIDQKLLDLFADAKSFRNFVETGTFRGDTAKFASTRFEKVWTVEASKKLYREAKQRLHAAENISIELSDSPIWLQRICKDHLDGNTVFWLDAHWCSAKSTEGFISQCPLLSELDAIEKLKPNDVILIDDARLYLTKPAPPHESSDWPTLTEVIEGLRRLSEVHEIRVVNDVLIFFPSEFRGLIDSYSDKYGRDLIELIWKSKEFDLIAVEFARKQKTFVGKLIHYIKKIGSRFFGYL